MRLKLKRTDLYEAKNLAIVYYFHRHALLSECSDPSILQLLMEYFYKFTYYINGVAI